MIGIAVVRLAGSRSCGALGELVFTSGTGAIGSFRALGCSLLCSAGTGVASLEGAAAGVGVPIVGDVMTLGGAATAPWVT